jgi:ABC-type multidrug transport system ATPase subunit
MKVPLITVSHLTVRSDEKVLLQDVNIEIYAGEITLLVGRSGSGKTVFMKILAALIDHATPHFAISGSVRVGGKEILVRLPTFSGKALPIGIVFQDYGLMDNYSLPQNLDFAFAHSPFQIPREQRESIALRLQQKLDLPSNLIVRHASGGQKRRMAIARTLAYNPEILIYDEPTSGLDVPMARKVAGLIRNTHEAFAKKSSIVVTHQYEDFLPFVDRILFLDSHAKTIQEVTAGELLERVQREEIPVASLPPAGLPLLPRVRHSIAAFLAATTSVSGRFLWYFLLALARLLPYWKSPKWGGRFLLHYGRLLAFVSSFVYIGMAALIIGFVGAYFTFKFLPYSQFTKPLITEDVLAALGYGLYRIIIPIFTAVLVAARCGAAATSDVGNRVYLQEVDAMRSLGASPSCYLQTGLTYAFLIGLPLLTFIAFFLARTVALLVFLMMHPQHNAVFADAIFHGFLRQGNSWAFQGTHWVIYKQLVCGFGLANICYAIGMRAKSSTQEISRDITGAVIWGTLFVLLTHLVFALLEF